MNRLKFYFFFFFIENGLFSLNIIDLNESDLVKFRHENSNGYSNMLLKNQHIYLSGTNYVFKLNSLNISDKSVENFKERSILPTIYANFNTSLREQSKNYVKFLGSRDSLNDLIICGTNLGQPHLYDLKIADLSNQLEYNGNFLCPGVFNQTSLGLIIYDTNYLKYQSTKKGIMYSAVWHSHESSLEYGIFSRYGIYRKEIEFNRNFIKTHFSPYWLWEPQFVSVIEDNEFIFYFFREFSIEEFKKSYPHFNVSSTKNFSDFVQSLASKNELTSFSRVARVCKSDKGMSSLKYSFLNHLWTSFRKIKMECNCKEQRSAIFENLIHVKVLDSNPNKLLGIFYHRFGEKEMSVLCEFDIGDLRQKLKTTKFKLNSNQNEYVDDMNKCDENEDEDVIKLTTGNNEENDSDTFYPDTNEKDMDKFNLFLSENTLLNEKFDGECKRMFPFEVKSLTIGRSLVYLLTSKSKIVILNDDYEILYEINTPFSSSNNQILVSETNNLLYIATLDELNQIDLNRIKEIACNKKEYCSECVTENGCQWNSELTPHCTRFNELVSKKSKDCSYVTIEDLIFKENQTVVLKCGNFSQHLTKRIGWYKNDVNLSKLNDSFIHFYSNKSDLILVNINFDIYSGLYSCKIDNNNILKKINLKVLKDSMPTLDGSNSILERISIETLQKNIDEWKNDTNYLKLKILEFENLINKTEC